MATTEEILKRYPQLGGFIDHPELGPLLQAASDEGLGAAELQGRLHKTKWWQTTWADKRKLEVLRGTDPAEYNLQVQQASAEITSLFGQLGVDINKNKHLLPVVVDAYMAHGKDEWYLFDRIGKELAKNPSLITETGQLANVKTDYRQLAHDFGLQYGDDVLTRYAIDEWRRLDSREGIEQRMRQEAIRRYGHLGDELKRGLTVKQIVQPMTNVVAQTLELSPDQIDINDARWRQLIAYQDPDTGKTRSMSVSEADRWARRQDEYQYTAGAREETYSMASDIIRSMGEI